jgi:hypothetical protein
MRSTADVVLSAERLHIMTLVTKRLNIWCRTIRDSDAVCRPPAHNHRPLILLLSISNMGISTKSSLIDKAIVAIRSGECNNQTETTRKYRVDKSSIFKYIRGKI